ncbi:hypothetical protein [Cytophaga hutchinsonii]|uniref:Uncharacterized protein n=1 Tax=Cytophaga hutchinsonii (strain ATCC 33406 / DSM 1761 / CIP 103989 / NBRC 15051 / NCIMB 9469 / D465) TaxID=269798 RepID=A0A6N4STD8_CYTH3|nr:hypothetical protein [Cytophaga hutchinsonii]ABG59641.1 conserved hypothetical protein [Cytophaga hutchinsonii ATCC 33406]SFX66731.1 hypothetical protein SAMN04487930_107148 [Cytophaga hutchinsonii ATCC 33406]
MGNISIVYGNIIGATWKTDDYHKLQRLNNKILTELPDADAYPWIHRHMFHTQDPHNIQGTYRDQVITFGASYKFVEYEWEEWLQKFEAILKTLYWTRATIHLETEFMGRFTYEWVIDFHQSDNWFLENPLPIQKWEFTGGPRKFFQE